ncbi:hypothetical protein SY2F82_35790 [Streptomyces sp. Y2F8-2]|nr:hypothetical protein SY2F82_35790 [Streptomyces sp. Y2F8-2]
MAARLQPCGEQVACFVMVDGTASLGRPVAVAGLSLDGWPARTDAEFHDLLRRPRTASPAAFLFGLPSLQSCDLTVEALRY